MGIVIGVIVGMLAAFGGGTFVGYKWGASAVGFEQRIVGIVERVKADLKSGK